MEVTSAEIIEALDQNLKVNFTLLTLLKNSMRREQRHKNSTVDLCLPITMQHYAQAEVHLQKAIYKFIVHQGPSFQTQNLMTYVSKLLLSTYDNKNKEQFNDQDSTDQSSDNQEGNRRPYSSSNNVSTAESESDSMNIKKLYFREIKQAERIFEFLRELEIKIRENLLMKNLNLEPKNEKEGEEVKKQISEQPHERSQWLNETKQKIFKFIENNTYVHQDQGQNDQEKQRVKRLVMKQNIEGMFVQMKKYTDEELINALRNQEIEILTNLNPIQVVQEVQVNRAEEKEQTVKLNDKGEISLSQLSKDQELELSDSDLGHKKEIDELRALLTYFILNAGQKISQDYSNEFKSLIKMKKFNLIAQGKQNNWKFFKTFEFPPINPKNYLSWKELLHSIQAYLKNRLLKQSRTALYLQTFVNPTKAANSFTNGLYCLEFLHMEKSQDLYFIAFVQNYDLQSKEPILFYINRMPPEEFKPFFILYFRYKDNNVLFQFRHRLVKSVTEREQDRSKGYWKPLNFLSLMKPALWTPKAKIFTEEYQKSKCFTFKYKRRNIEIDFRIAMKRITPDIK